MSIEGCPHGPYDPAECADCKSVAEHHQAVTAHAEAKIKTLAECVQDEKDKIIRGLEADLAKCREEGKWALVGRDTLQLELYRFKRIGLQLEAERDEAKRTIITDIAVHQKDLQSRQDSVEAAWKKNVELEKRITALEAGLKSAVNIIEEEMGSVPSGLTDLIGEKGWR